MDEKPLNPAPGPGRDPLHRDDPDAETMTYPAGVVPGGPSPGPVPPDEPRRDFVRPPFGTRETPGPAHAVPAAAAAVPAGPSPYVPIEPIEPPAPGVDAGRSSSRRTVTGAAGAATRRVDDRRIIDGGRPPHFYTRRLGVLDFLLALLLIPAGYFAVATTYAGMGLAWDESLYHKPALAAADWTLAVAKGDRAPLAAEAVEAAWGGKFEGTNRPEIGPVPKLAIGLGARLLTDRGYDESTASRLPMAGAFGLTLALVYLLAAKEYGKLGGMAAALAYGLTPRVFGHAHLAASETLQGFAVAATSWAFLSGASGGWLAIPLLAPAFALAVGTKVTALLLPLPFILWGQLYRRRHYATNIFAMAVVAPVLLVAVWPWLWHDGPAKLLSYLNFYATHQSTAVWFEGRRWGFGNPNAPWTYPGLVTAAATPEWVLALAAFGLLRAVVRVWARPASVFFAMMALWWIGLASLPGAPKYDGERLFFPAFLFIALLAGGGFAGFVDLVRESFQHGAEREGRDPAPVGRSVGRNGFAALMLLAAWGAFEMWQGRPNWINHFNLAVGHSAGARDKGFETSYWAESVNEPVLKYLTETVKPGQKVKLLALPEEAFKLRQEWGNLPEGVDFAPAAPPYDWIVIQHRLGFFARTERALTGGATKPVRSFDTRDGVPLIQVYAGADWPSGDAVKAAPDDTGTTGAAASTPTPVLAPAVIPTPAVADPATTAAGPESARP